jgi:cytosine permease
LIALGGVSALEKCGVVIAPLLVILLLVSLNSACPPVSRYPLSESTGALSLGAAVSAVVGMYIVGIVVQPDYARFVRAPVMAGLSSGLALSIAFPCILVFSALPASRCGARDLIGVLTSQGFGKMALALLLLGAWIDASVSLYSGALSLTNQFRLRQSWVVVVITVLSCALVILRADRHLLPYLGGLSVALPPIATVHAFHAVVENCTEQPKKALRWGPIFAWLVGSLAGAGSQLHVWSITGVAALDSVAAAAAVLLVFFLRQSRKTRYESVSCPE